MAISLTHGLRVVRFEDNVYGVYDANRYLGGVVLHIEHDGRKRFRAFGQDFSSLGDGVKAFLDVPGVAVCNP